MDFNELKKKYESIPQSLRLLKRWVCFQLIPENNADGTKRMRKMPKAPIVGRDVSAKANDPSTWGTFDEALNAMAKNNYDGIGLEFGLKGDETPIFGVDLDYHPEKATEVSIERFHETLDEFEKGLCTYAEYSPSGKGFHFFCFGKVPEGRRRNETKAAIYGSVEIYGSERFFTVTGRPYGTPRPVAERTNEIIPLWKKYVDDTEERAKAALEAQRKQEEWEKNHKNYKPIDMSDEQIIAKAKASPAVGYKFTALYAGDMSLTNGDHSKADLALCNYLAFFTNGNAEQMDRIFRSSGLMREKWDRKWGDSTYGQKTIEFAISGTSASIAVTEFPTTEKKSDNQKQLGDDGEATEPTYEKPAGTVVMNIDDKGRPIFRVDKFKPGQKYPLTDTGNAQRFYDLFGSEFHYNATDKKWMFWTGKTWVVDVKGYIREYANEFIRLLAEELKEIDNQVENEPNEAKQKLLKSQYDAYKKNWGRVSSKAGKDAMISELQTYHDIPVENKEFNSDPYLLNTDSGVVDLKTGKIMDFRKELMMASNTKVKVSYDEPKTWIKFLHGIFERGNPQETEEIIECLRRCLGYTMTGDVSEQVMFLLYGKGSNGKSKLSEVLKKIMGDYYNAIDSSQLMVNKNQSTAVQNSLAEMLYTRYLETQETEQGAMLSEKLVKQMSGGDELNAQKKYGTPFHFTAHFKVWMMTNHKPKIIGTDYGIWRRLFLFPFLHRFTDEEKDIHMGEKLAKEYPQILGWCIKGAVDYLSETDGGFKQPACLKAETKNYQDENDVVSEFLKKQCRIISISTESCDAVYDSYSQWCKRNNDYCMKERWFREEMKNKGFECVEDDVEGWVYKGIRLLGTSLHNSIPSYPIKKHSSGDWDS